MRPPVLAILLTACAGTAHAGGLRAASANPPTQGSTPPAQMHLPLDMRVAPQRVLADDEARLRLGAPEDLRHDDLLAGSAVSIGPLRARLGGSSTRAHIARYRIEGMDVLGGSVSGTIDGRGARVYLRWPPSDDE